MLPYSTSNHKTYRHSLPLHLKLTGFRGLISAWNFSDAEV